MGMTFESAELGDPTSPPTELELESLLGPAQGRYFGAGYRTVRYSIQSAASLEPMGIEAIGRAVYPSHWSTDGRGSARAAHLSSVDAVILPLVAAEHLASPQERQGLARCRVTSIDLRAGTSPWLALDAVPVELALDGAGMERRLSGMTGNIRLNITLTAAGGQHEPKVGAWTADGPSVYAGLLQLTHTQTTVRDLNATAGELYGSHAVSFADALTPSAGLEALWWPAPTVIDYLVTMGQLTQALVYASAGTTRSDAGPLWMRTMKIEIDTLPSRLPSHFDTTTRILRDRVLKRAGERVHDVAVESVATSGVRARATLAYKETPA